MKRPQVVSAYFERIESGIDLAPWNTALRTEEIKSISVLRTVPVPKVQAAVLFPAIAARDPYMVSVEKRTKAQ